MADDSPYRLALDNETRQALELDLCRRVLSAVAGAEERNNNIQTWRDQLEGFSVTAANQSWADACNLPDPISMIAFLTILSQLLGSLHRDPKVAVEAFSKDDEEGAQVIEQWLSMESSRSSLDARLYDFAYDACWAPYAVGYAGYEKRSRTLRETGYKKPGSGRIYTEEETEDGEEYDTVPIAEEVVEERYVIRSVDPSDFFMFPSTSLSIDDADMVCERMFVTESALWDGVDDLGYSEAAVEQLVALGPSPRTDDQVIQDSQDGLTDADDSGNNSGFYEIHMCYTRLPRRVSGGKEKLPKHLMQDDFLFVCSPDRNICLKLEFSEHKLERPYFQGGILPKPRRSVYHSLMAMLEGIQSEANANLQFTIDNYNLTASPFLIGPETEQDNIAKWTVQPGGFGKETTPGSIRALEWDRAPLRDGLAWQQSLQGRATALVAAEGQGQLQNKVRKNAEVQATETAASAKFGMYLTCFQRTIVAELYRRLVSLKLQFGDVDDDGEEFLDPEGHSHKLTSRALRGKYNIVAAGTSMTHSPEARIEISKQKQAVQAGYFQAAAAGLPPDKLKLVWHGAREIMFDLGEHNPEAWLGEEPKDKPQEPPPGAGQPQQQGPPQGGPPQAGSQQPPVPQGV